MTSSRFRILTLGAIILSTVLFYFYDHFQRRASLISQSADRTEHIVSHDLNVHLDQLNQVIEKIEQFCQPTTPCAFEAQSIKKELNEIWKLNRKKLNSSSIMKDFDPTILQINDIKVKSLKFINSFGNSNPKLKNELLLKIQSTEQIEKKVSASQNVYKSVLETRKKFEDNFILKFFLIRSRTEH